VTDQEAEVDEHEQDLDAHGPGALAMSRRTLFTTQFHDSLTCRLHVHCHRTHRVCRLSTAPPCHFSLPENGTQTDVLVTVD